jgi:SAM-dependent methyltransferase
MNGSDDTPQRRRHGRSLAPLKLLRLARRRPVSQSWGWDRGLPVDRHYVEQFLSEHRGDIRGRVLEVKTAEYARRFGTHLERVEVLDIDTDNSEATIIGDLASPADLPEAAFDCFVLTQTLQYVYDVRAAVRNAARALRPGGILLATVPGISRTSSDRPGRAEELWRFTPAACRELAAREFGDSAAAVRGYGNALTAAAFIAGLAAEELSRASLDAHDDRFPLLISLRAVRR